MNKGKTIMNADSVAAAKKLVATNIFARQVVKILSGKDLRPYITKELHLGVELSIRQAEEYFAKQAGELKAALDQDEQTYVYEELVRQALRNISYAFDYGEEEEEEEEDDLDLINVRRKKKLIR